MRAQCGVRRAARKFKKCVSPDVEDQTRRLPVVSKQTIAKSTPVKTRQVHGQLNVQIPDSDVQQMVSKDTMS